MKISKGFSQLIPNGQKPMADADQFLALETHFLKVKH